MRFRRTLARRLGSPRTPGTTGTRIGIVTMPPVAASSALRNNSMMSFAGVARDADRRAALEIGRSAGSA